MGGGFGLGNIPADLPVEVCFLGFKGFGKSDGIALYGGGEAVKRVDVNGSAGQEESGGVDFTEPLAEGFAGGKVPDLQDGGGG